MTRFSKFLVASAAGAVLTCGVTPEATAAVILDFEGLHDLEAVEDFYDGGQGSLGSGPGPDFGVIFGSDALACIDSDTGGSCNTANEPSPETTVIFLGFGSIFMNVPAGFDTGLSFFYSSPLDGVVTVFDDVNGTGNPLGTINLTETFSNCTLPGDPTGPYNCWVPIGVAFAGIAKSVNFSGAANFIGFDDITLGSAAPGQVPEPVTLLMLGFGLALGGRRFRRGLAIPRGQ